VNWWVAGILAMLFFAFYALFSKLSSFHPVISNLIIYTTAAICGIILVLATERRISFSKEGFLSGIFSNIAALTMLYSLVSNQMLVVFSFVSFASVIFFLIVWVTEKPKLSGKQQSIAATGILVSVFGLFFASTSTVGGISYLLSNSIVDPYFLILAPLMPLGFGFWAYFSFAAIKKKNASVPIVFFNYSFASSAIAATAYLLSSQGSGMPVSQELSDFFPVIAGLFVAGGVILALKSYRMTSGESRIEETIVAILANAEIVPLIFLSYFILREFSVEGFVGALTVFVGLSILNSARAS
jgi:drug/metabolite transporter (DMT)-like permease